MPMQTKLQKADRAIVPVEGPAESAAAIAAGGGEDLAVAAAPYGANNEQLPERMQEALRRLVLQFSTESESTRRQEIRRIKQAHQFWRGLQYLWWDERDQNWHLPFEQKLTDGSSLEDMPRYEFVTNIYQAFGLSLISVLSQDVPRVRFFPSSAQAEEDVAAAKAATEVAALVERNNRIGNLIVDEAFQSLDRRKGWRVRALRRRWAAVRVSSGDGDWRARGEAGRRCVRLPGVRRGNCRREERGEHRGTGAGSRRAWQDEP